MNIFEDYLKKINKLISKNQKLLGLNNLNDFKDKNAYFSDVIIYNKYNCLNKNVF